MITSIDAIQPTWINTKNIIENFREENFNFCTYMNKLCSLEVKAELMNSQNILNCNQLMVPWVDLKSSASDTTCCKLSTGMDNVVLHPTMSSTRLFSHDNNAIIQHLFNHQYCYNLLTRLSNNDNNNKQACSINIVFSCFNNREQPLLLHQCWTTLLKQ